MSCTSSGASLRTCGIAFPFQLLHTTEEGDILTHFVILCKQMKGIRGKKVENVQLNQLLNAGHCPFQAITRSQDIRAGSKPRISSDIWFGLRLSAPYKGLP